MRTLSILLTFCVAISMIQGCETPRIALGKKPPAEQEIADVPVPLGFKFIKKKSYIHDKSYRYIVLQYVRPHYKKVDPVVRFYKDYMPKSGWQLEWIVGTGDHPKLYFKKGYSECEIDVARSFAPDLKTPVVKARITIGPKKT